MNFPEQEYKDVFGGTLGTAAAKEADKHKLGLFSGESSAMQDHQADKRRNSLRAAAKNVDNINAGH